MVRAGPRPAPPPWQSVARHLPARPAHAPRRNIRCKIRRPTAGRPVKRRLLRERARNRRRRRRAWPRAGRARKSVREQAGAGTDEGPCLSRPGRPGAHGHRPHRWRAARCFASSHRRARRRACCGGKDHTPWWWCRERRGCSAVRQGTDRGMRSLSAGVRPRGGAEAEGSRWRGASRLRFVQRSSGADGTARNAGMATALHDTPRSTRVRFPPTFGSLACSVKGQAALLRTAHCLARK